MIEIITELIIVLVLMFLVIVFHEFGHFLFLIKYGIPSLKRNSYSIEIGDNLLQKIPVRESGLVYLSGFLFGLIPIVIFLYLSLADVLSLFIVFSLSIYSSSADFFYSSMIKWQHPDLYEKNITIKEWDIENSKRTLSKWSKK